VKGGGKFLSILCARQNDSASHYEKEEIIGCGQSLILDKDETKSDSVVNLVTVVPAGRDYFVWICVFCRRF